MTPTGWEITGGIVPGMTVDFNRRRRVTLAAWALKGGPWILQPCFFVSLDHFNDLNLHRTFILWNYCCLDSWIANIKHLWCGEALWLSTSVLQRLWAQRLRSPLRAEFPPLNVLDFRVDSAAPKKAWKVKWVGKLQLTHEVHWHPVGFSSDAYGSKSLTPQQRQRLICRRNFEDPPVLPFNIS